MQGTSQYISYIILMPLLTFYFVKLNLAVYLTVKTEKKTVQFSDEVQVETIEPEPEPVYIDEVSMVKILIGIKCSAGTEHTSKIC